MNMRWHSREKQDRKQEVATVCGCMNYLEKGKGAQYVREKTYHGPVTRGNKEEKTM